MSGVGVEGRRAAPAVKDLLTDVSVDGLSVWCWWCVQLPCL